MKMGDKESSVTMEPLLSPTKSGKVKVKAARFQVGGKKNLSFNRKWRSSSTFAGGQCGGRRRRRG